MRAQFPAKLEPLFRPHRYKVIKGGRGSGKSWGVARALLIQARTKRMRVLCTREVQKSIKDSVHALLSDQIEALGFGSDFDILDTEIRCRVSGSVFLFAGLQQHTVDSIKSFEGCDVVWIEEAHSVSGKSWDVLVPTIRKPGSEIWVTYNPQLDTDEVHQRFVVNTPPGAVVITMNWSDNPWFPSVLDAERNHARATMVEAKYLHIWEGQCMPAVEGAIYFDEVAKAEKQERITRVTADKLLRTHAVWDLGWNDSMSIIMVQRSASELRVIDYIEDSHKKLSDYVLMLRGDVGGLVEAGLKPEDAAKHAHRRGYTWGDDWIPHDGFAKDYKTGKSADEMLRAMGRSVKQTPSMDIEGGIKAAREVFERVWFDKDKAARLIECLKRYRRNIGQRTGEAGTPLHDEFSHGADAFRYMGLVADQLRNNTSRPRVNLGRHEVAGNGGFLAA
jgi:phage terminase large subunit